MTDIIAFQPDKVKDEEEKKFGQALKELSEEEVTIENYENFLKRVNSQVGGIEDDIKQLKKTNEQLMEDMESKKDDFDDQYIKDIREDGYYDFQFASIDVEDTLAYRIMRNIEMIETKRAYKSAHWRLVASTLEEILGRLQSIDAVVKKSVDEAQADIVKSIRSTETEIIDTVNEETQNLDRQLGSVERLLKSDIKLTQEISQQFAVNSEDLLTANIDQLVEEEGSEEDVDSDSEGRNTDDLGNSSSDDLPFELKGKSPVEKKEVLDTMVDQVEDLEDMKKSEIVALVDITRQGMYYSESSVISEVEEKFETSYPELK